MNFLLSSLGILFFLCSWCLPKDFEGGAEKRAGFSPSPTLEFARAGGPPSTSLRGRAPNSLTAQGRPGSHAPDDSVRRMTDAIDFRTIPTTPLADLLCRGQVMDIV